MKTTMKLTPGCRVNLSYAEDGDEAVFIKDLGNGYAKVWFCGRGQAKGAEVVVALAMVSEEGAARC